MRTHPVCQRRLRRRELLLHTLTWSHNTFLHTLLPWGFDQPKSDCNMPLEACARQRSQQRVLKKEPSVRCVPMKSHLCHTRPRTQHTLSQVALQPQQRINTNAARGDTHARWACVVDLPADFLNELTCACSGLDPAPTCDATVPAPAAMDGNRSPSQNVFKGKTTTSFDLTDPQKKKKKKNSRPVTAARSTRCSFGHTRVTKQLELHTYLPIYHRTIQQQYCKDRNEYEPQQSRVIKNEASG